MIAAIMQPYFFPYLGYFQLIAASDVFVSLDDVQYVQRRWINRNCIQGNANPRWLTFPVENAPRHLPIRARSYSSHRDARERLVRQVAAAYRNAPLFQRTMPLIESLLGHPEQNVARFNLHALRTIARFVGIETPMLEASALDIGNPRAADERLARLCLAVGADTYLNPAGGSHLYSASAFEERGVRLSFLVPRLPPDGSVDAAGAFMAPMSIIHCLMHRDPIEISKLARLGQIVGSSSGAGAA